MPDHPTPPSGIPSTPSQISGVEVLARLIDIQRSVERGNDRLEKIEGSIGDLKKVDASLGDRVTDVHQALVTLRTRVERLEEDRNDDRRALTEDRDARAKEREAIIAHVAKLDGSIGDAVREAVQPLADKVAVLEENDKARALALRSQDEQLTTVVRLLTNFARWQFPWYAKVALAFGAAIGGVIAGYFAARGH